MWLKSRAGVHIDKGSLPFRLLSNGLIGLAGFICDVLGQGVQLALLHANAHEAEAKEEGIRLVKVCHCSATIRYGPNKFHFQSHNLTGTATSRTPDFLSPVDMQSATPHWLLALFQPWFDAKWNCNSNPPMRQEHAIKRESFPFNGHTVPWEWELGWNGIS